MGSSGSKAARSAAGSAARKYPARPSTQPPSTSRTAPVPPRSAAAGDRAAGPTVHPRPHASSSRDEVIDLDARDPQFAGRLSQLGPVKPAPTYSPSATTKSPPSSSDEGLGGAPGAPAYPAASASPAIAVLTARQRIQEAVEQERIEAGRRGFAGTQYLDITTVKKALTLRDERGMKPADIEKALNLKAGVMASLGRVGVVEVV